MLVVNDNVKRSRDEESGMYLGVTKYVDDTQKERWLYQETVAFLERCDNSKEQLEYIRRQEVFRILADSKDEKLIHQVVPSQYSEIKKNVAQYDTKIDYTSRIITWIKEKLKDKIDEIAYTTRIALDDAKDCSRIRSFLDCQQRRLLVCQGAEIVEKRGNIIDKYVEIPTDIELDITLSSSDNSKITFDSIDCKRILKRKNRYERTVGADLVCKANTKSLEGGLKHHISNGHEYDIKDLALRPLFLAPPWVAGRHESYWTLNALDAIAVFDKTLLIGKARSGKSTSLKILSLALTQKYLDPKSTPLNNRLLSNLISGDKQYIPIYVDMNDMYEWLSLENNRDKKNVIETYFEFLKAKGSHKTGKQCKDCWSFCDESRSFKDIVCGDGGHNILLILDNYFDGIETSAWNSRANSEGGVLNFIDSTPGIKIVIARRANEGQDWFKNIEFEQVVLKNFDENSVFGFFVNQMNIKPNISQKEMFAQKIRHELRILGFDINSLNSPRFLSRLVEYAIDCYKTCNNEKYFFIKNEEDRGKINQTIIIRRCLYSMIADMAKEAEFSVYNEYHHENLITSDILKSTKYFDTQKRSQESRTAFQWFKALLCDVAGHILAHSFKANGTLVIQQLDLEQIIEGVNIEHDDYNRKNAIIKILSGKNGLLVKSLKKTTDGKVLYEFENTLIFKFLAAKCIIAEEELLQSFFDLVFSPTLKKAFNYNDDISEEHILGGMSNVEYLERIICLLLLRKKQVLIKDINPYALLIWTLIEEIINVNSEICLSCNVDIGERVWLACRIISAERYQLILDDKISRLLISKKEETLSKLKEAIIDQLQTPVCKSVLKIDQRIDLGNVLGQIGDMRRGVGVIRKEKVGEKLNGVVVTKEMVGIPDIFWVEVQGGSFEFGLSNKLHAKIIDQIQLEAKTEIEVEKYLKEIFGTLNISMEESFSREIPSRRINIIPFHVSKFIVTNLQFSGFVDDKINGMYSTNWERWYDWAKASREYHNVAMNDATKIEEAIQFRNSEKTLRPNYPAVAVSWFDAIAFCKWFTFVLQSNKIMSVDETIRLPSEAEWEFFSGKNQKIFPWRDEIDVMRCNNGLSMLGEVVPLGVFANCDELIPEELAGNIWEWTQSFFTEKHAEDPTTPVEIIDIYNNCDIRSTDLVTVKGGGYLNRMNCMRNTYRGCDNAGDNFKYHGFRLVKVKKNDDYSPTARPTKTEGYSHLKGYKCCYLRGSGELLNIEKPIEIVSEATFVSSKSIFGSGEIFPDLPTTNRDFEMTARLIDEKLFSTCFHAEKQTILHSVIFDAVKEMHKNSALWIEIPASNIFSNKKWGGVHPTDFVIFRIYVKG